MEMNKDSQAILILCSNLCVGECIEPLKPSEWKILAKTILEKNLTPGDLIDMDLLSLRTSLGCDELFAERLERLIGRSASLFFEISKYENIGISIITRADKDYPQKLKKKLGDSCPPYFYYAGDLSLLNKRAVGFVGSRHLNEEDIDFETRLVKEAVKLKNVIVSGGARGADSVSETIALNNRGCMIEFLSDSMLRKLQKSEIIKAIQKGKLLILSVPNPDAGFNVGNAMNRNKYIYAQSNAVIAVKSINRGGTWNGVIESIKHGICPVYCWNNQSYRDNIELIKNGAIPIDEEWSIKMIGKKPERKDDNIEKKEAKSGEGITTDKSIGEQLSLFNK